MVTDESIIFTGFGRSHQYKWEEVEEYTLKDYGYVGKSFIKIGKYRLLGGRYWVSSKLEGYRELLSILQSRLEGRESHESSNLSRSK